MSDAMNELVRLSEELGLYDATLHTCDICKDKSGYLTRTEVGVSKILCDNCYLGLFGYKRN